VNTGTRPLSRPLFIKLAATSSLFLTPRSLSKNGIVTEPVNAPVPDHIPV